MTLLSKRNINNRPFVSADVLGEINVSGQLYELELSNTAVAADGTLILAFRTPAIETRITALFGWTSNASGRNRLYEGPTWTTSTGTAGVPRNHNRILASPSKLEGDATGTFTANEIVQNPTGGTGGTLIAESYFAGQRSDPIMREVDRYGWILAPQTTYLIECTNLDTQVQGMSVLMAWAEE